jgi:hypothetical protein
MFALVVNDFAAVLFLVCCAGLAYLAIIGAGASKGVLERCDAHNASYQQFHDRSHKALQDIDKQLKFLSGQVDQWPEGVLVGVGLLGLQADLSRWSQQTFGTDAQRGPIGALKHLAKEALEALQAYEQGLADSEALGAVHIDEQGRKILAEIALGKLSFELADCLIIWLDAVRRCGLDVYRILSFAEEKMVINKQREWPKPTSPTEPVEHVRTEAAPVAEQGYPNYPPAMGEYLRSVGGLIMKSMRCTRCGKTYGWCRRIYQRSNVSRDGDRDGFVRHKATEVQTTWVFDSCQGAQCTLAPYEFNYTYKTGALQAASDAGLCTIDDIMEAYPAHRPVSEAEDRMLSGLDLGQGSLLRALWLEQKQGTQEAKPLKEFSEEAAA